MIWLHSEASWRMSLGFVVTISQEEKAPQTTNLTMSDDDKPRGKAPYPGAKWCSNPEHGWCGHSTQQCKGKQRSVQNTSGKGERQRGIKCFGCGELGHRVYDCPTYGDKIRRTRTRKTVKCFFCAGPHFVSECPRRSDPDFDINDVLDKWDVYRSENPKPTKSDQAAEAKAMDAKQKAGRWMIRIKSGTCSDIGEKDINTLLDLIEDDEWMLEWPQSHLRECTVGGLQSEAEMQALSTRIR